MKEKYTILMSVYYKECPEYLKVSIESILAQTIQPYQIIIIKDGKLTEELDQVIAEYEEKNKGLFKIIEFESNKGLGEALRIGIDASETELIARMDSDDYSVPDRCEKQLECFKKNPKLEVVGSFEAEFTKSLDKVTSIHRVPETHKEIKKFMRKRCALLHPTVMYKKSSVLQSGSYRTVPLYEDYDLFVRMVIENNAYSYNIQENLYYIRTSEDFFKRRGGVKYMKTVLRFKWNQFIKGNMSLLDFSISGIGQAIVCLLPNSLRRLFYMKLLRNNSHEEGISDE